MKIIDSLLIQIFSKKKTGNLFTGGLLSVEGK